MMTPAASLKGIIEPAFIHHFKPLQTVDPFTERALKRPTNESIARAPSPGCRWNVGMTHLMKVTCAGKAQLTVILGGDRLRFVDGSASALVEPGEHPFIWVAAGEVGSRYSVAIVEPSKVSFQHAAVLDDSGRDAGIYWVSL